MASYNEHVLVERKSIESDAREIGLEAASPSPGNGYGDTQNDLSDMQRLGKKQEFKRNFNLLSTLGFISIYMATWEFVLVSLSVGLTNGGFAGLFWVFIGTVICYSPIVASLAEMESMAPTSGGQYHWVSEFSPPKYQKFMSYTAGWMSSLGWTASFASSVFILTTLVEAIIDIRNAGFSFAPWQYTLIMIAYLLITIGFNTWGAKLLPMIETTSLFGHLAGFLVTIIPLWIMAPKNSARTVFLDVVNNGGWSNTSTSCLIAQVSVLYCNIGSDSAVHISEEVEDASVNVPRAMWWSYILNVVLGFIMLITMVFCIGPLDAAIASPAPCLRLFLNTGSDAMATTLMIILLILVFSGNITALATTSRELWAFSRDKGFPFSTWISRMNHALNVPPNAIYLTSILTILLCLINLGSSFAFHIIISLSLLALLSTYMMSIGCVLLKRIKGELLPPARWSLGRFGLPINAFAFAYSGFVMVWSCFPSEAPVTVKNANWAPAVWLVVIVVAGLIYVVHGKKHYTPPVVFVEGRRASDRLQVN
ncbi:90bd4527-1b05-4edc-9b49-a094a9315455 [Sclerotinia trifoliorum]|uniref:90bd4527-1b05-4edc-9b49-a094a9315455 n=1 Tax=Sclerotinia trifoliorum TaxID=28548 RepID=A0A8H2VQN5_9HELO|nr:90bd4527-1b05-4edc-9b49-a094a9315455 [Sclerotinia trifoliorum]